MRKIICNVSQTQYELVKQILASKGWILQDDQECELLWTDFAFPTQRFTKMKLYQKTNHFPGMHTIAKKNCLAWNLKRLQKHLPSQFSFFPRTWVLPADMPDLKAAWDKKQIFIVKPEALSQGKGIFLTKKIGDINFSERTVVQQYVRHPFLLENLKFDLRIYVLVTCCDPLRIFIHQEGLTRFATQQYEPPSRYNLNEPCMHLTNYAINKNSKKFVFNQDSHREIGHKRSLESTYSALSDLGHNSERLREDIDEIIVKTLISAQKSLAHTYRTCQPKDFLKSMCFQILGFDILIDKNLKPWLLEVNHSPSFIADTPLDQRIKTRVLTQTLNLVHIQPRKAKRDSHLESWEENHLGGFRKIYPNSKYQLVEETAQSVWDDWIQIKHPKPKKKAKPEPKVLQYKSKITAKSRYRTASVVSNKLPQISLPPVRVRKSFILPQAKILFNLGAEDEVFQTADTHIKEESRSVNGYNRASSQFGRDDNWQAVQGKTVQYTPKRSFISNKNVFW